MDKNQLNLMMRINKTLKILNSFLIDWKVVICSFNIVDCVNAFSPAMKRLSRNHQSLLQDQRNKKLKTQT
jgi:hypothetical protein